MRNRAGIEYEVRHVPSPMSAAETLSLLNGMADEGYVLTAVTPDSVYVFARRAPVDLGPLIELERGRAERQINALYDASPVPRLADGPVKCARCGGPSQCGGYHHGVWITGWFCPVCRDKDLSNLRTRAASETDVDTCQPCGGPLTYSARAGGWHCVACARKNIWVIDTDRRTYVRITGAESLELVDDIEKASTWNDPETCNLFRTANLRKIHEAGCVGCSTVRLSEAYARMKARAEQ